MTPEQLAEIEARAKAATEQETEIDRKFGTFIHHYGKDIPDLIAEVRRLQQQNEFREIERNAARREYRKLKQGQDG